MKETLLTASNFTIQRGEILIESYIFILQSTIEKMNVLFISYESTFKFEFGDDLGFMLAQDIVNKVIDSVESLLKKGEIDNEKSQNMKEQLNSEDIIASIYANIFKQTCNYIANQLPAPKRGCFFS